MTVMLELKRVSRRFEGLMALSEVEMSLQEGRITGLIGPNGAGKTTLLNCISGLDHASRGEIVFQDKAIQSFPPYRITGQGISRTYQSIRLFGEMTVLQNVLVAQYLSGGASVLDALFQLPRHRHERLTFHEKGMELLDRFGLRGEANHLAASLPYGAQRRLEMARALATRPKLLLLDEPTAGMNPVETYEFGEQVLKARDEGLTVLIVEHDMALIGQVCDEVYVLNFGKIIAHGTPEQIKNDPRVVEAYLGEED